MRVPLALLLRFVAVAAVVVGIVAFLFDRMFYAGDQEARYLYEGLLVAAGVVTWLLFPLTRDRG
jgi:hypothetical protein